MNPQTTTTDIEKPRPVEASDLAVGVVFLVFVAVTIFSGGNFIAGFFSALLFGVPAAFVVVVLLGIREWFA